MAFNRVEVFAEVDASNVRFTRYSPEYRRKLMDEARKLTFTESNGCQNKSPSKSELHASPMARRA